MQEQEKTVVKGRDIYDWIQALVGSVLAVVLLFTFVIRLVGVDVSLSSSFAARVSSS